MNIEPGSEVGTFESASTLGDLRIHQEAILSRLRDAQYPERDLFHIRLALEEAMINAFDHGNGRDPEKMIRGSYVISEKEFLITIEDEGCGFDPDRVPDPTLPENLEKESGRGILLMRSVMTKVTYNKKGNCVTMWKEKSHVASHTPHTS